MLHPCVTVSDQEGFWSHLMAEPDLELLSPGLYFCSALWKRRGEVDVFTFRSPSLRPPNCSMQWLYFRCLILKTQGPYIGDKVNEASSLSPAFHEHHLEQQAQREGPQPQRKSWMVLLSQAVFLMSWRDHDVESQKFCLSDTQGGDWR